MGILSDKQLKKLCKPPRYVIEREIAIVKNDEDGNAYRDIITTKEFTDVDFEDQEKADKYIEKNQQTSKGVMTVVRELIEQEILSTKPLIYPFYKELVIEKLNISTGLPEKIIPYGLDSFIYNIRLSSEFMIYKNTRGELADPKNFDPEDYTPYNGSKCIIPPDCFCVAQSVEIFNIPSVITGIVTGNKMISRAGIECMTSFISSNHNGKLLLEFMNNTSVPAVLYAGEGAAQAMFFRSDITQI